MGKNNWRQIITFMGAVLAYMMGSGFATGQELLQYYVSYGYQGILVGITLAAILIFANWGFAKTGHQEGCLLYTSVTARRKPKTESNFGSNMAPKFTTIQRRFNHVSSSYREPGDDRVGHADFFSGIPEMCIRDRLNTGFTGTTVTHTFAPAQIANWVGYDGDGVPEGILDTSQNRLYLGTGSPVRLQKRPVWCLTLSLIHI